MADQVQVEEIADAAGEAPAAPSPPPPPAGAVLAISKQGDTDPDADDEMDETLVERLVGLTEMLPEPVRNAAWQVVGGSVWGVKGAYGLLCASSWVFFSSAAILFVPLIFEIERAQMEEMHKQQQRQILLGPNAAVSGSMMPPQASSGK